MSLLPSSASAATKNPVLPMLIVGAGKAGHFFAHLFNALRPRLISFRGSSREDWWPEVPSIVIFAIRDTALLEMTGWQERAFPSGSVVFHCSGFLDNAPFAMHRACSDASVVFGRMHPYHSIVGEIGKSTSVPWIGVDGDDRAIEIAHALLHQEGIRSFSLAGIGPTRYHASAAVLSNGAIALASIAEKLLVSSGMTDEALRRSLLASILRSVADNVEVFGVTPSLSGPVRRGDLGAVERILANIPPHAFPLVRESLAVQADLAEALGEENSTSFQGIRAALKRRERP